jgi:hypothetical protein
MPYQVQLSPVFAIETGDFNKDGNLDLLFGGNLYRVKPEVGRYDASYGTLLLGDGKGGFSYVAASESGLRVHGEIRDFIEVTVKGKKELVAARNNDIPVIFRIKNQ